MPDMTEPETPLQADSRDQADAQSPASRREVLRDFGAVLSAAVIVPGPHRAVTGGQAGQSTGQSAGPSAALVPAYFHPADFPAEWAALCDPRLLAVVLNVDDGPGTARDPQFITAIADIESAGGTVVGYVDSAYGTRSAAEIETAARRYRDWYGIADVFLDQVPATASALPTYQQISSVLRAREAEFIVFNHGVHPDPGYAAIADLLVTFEGTWPAYQQMEPPPAWVRELPAKRFCHLVYATPSTAVGSALSLAGQRRAGVVYVTDGDGANPWGGLPGYFDQELALIDE